MYAEQECNILFEDGEHLTVHGAVVGICGDIPDSYFWWFQRRCGVCTLKIAEVAWLLESITNTVR